MSKDIIKRGADTYALLPQADDYGIQIGLLKNGSKIADCVASATIEVATDFQWQVGERLLDTLKELVRGEVERGVFDQM